MCIRDSDRSGGAFSNLKISQLESTNGIKPINNKKSLPDDTESWLKFHPTDAGVLRQFVQNKLNENQIQDARKKINYALKLTPYDHNLIAVSYTHLDVYKRQALPSLQKKDQSWPNFKIPPVSPIT